MVDQALLVGAATEIKAIQDASTTHYMWATAAAIKLERGDPKAAP